MAFPPPRPPLRTRRRLCIRTRSLAGPPPSKEDQLTRPQPHRHYLCPQAALRRLQTIGATIHRGRPPAPTRSTTNRHMPLFRLHQAMTLAIPRKTALADTTRPRVCTRTHCHPPHKRLHTRLASEQTPSRRVLFPTFLLLSQTAMSTSRLRLVLHTVRTSSSTTS
jgi:hypothetical protein